MLPGLGHAAPKYNIDRDQISVSGISSGGYMATQLHVAYSKTFNGAGVIAGGVYDCAENSQYHAYKNPFSLDPGEGRCLNNPKAPMPPGTHFCDIARREASAGRIDPLDNLNGDHVFIFTGSEDELVNNNPVDALADFYKCFTDPANIVYSRDELASGHGFPTENTGLECKKTGPPFIENCNYDAAGKLLQQLYPGLVTKTRAVPKNLHTFDQTDFLQAAFQNSSPITMAKAGFIYVPSACANGATCRLHIALHGCQQNADAVDDEFAWHAGYNEWAEANNIIVVYPQTSGAATNGCWNWWGESYADHDQYYYNQQGRQMRAIKHLVDCLIDENCPILASCATGSNRQHADAGRATSFLLAYFARGSNQFLGFSGNDISALKETKPNYFEKTAGCL